MTLCRIAFDCYDESISDINWATTRKQANASSTNILTLFLNTWWSFSFVRGPPTLEKTSLREPGPFNRGPVCSSPTGGSNQLDNAISVLTWSVFVSSADAGGNGGWTSCGMDAGGAINVDVGGNGGGGTTDGVGGGTALGSEYSEWAGGSGGAEGGNGGASVIAGS